MQHILLIHPVVHTMSVTFDAAPWSGKLPREADAALPLLVPRGSTAQTPAPRFAFDLAFARRFGVLLKNFLASSPWHWLGILSLVLCSSALCSPRWRSHRFPPLPLPLSSPYSSLLIDFHLFIN